ncbi:hypothetical protein RF11_03278 [Thelohanellus kitauei]|uniref:Uncharacterized protein n=1 Tax=Thelohanellus kitauei TaxID=669202 RepID=A0A0C2IKF7_THEKT|nr:hypothetical protein RF11_03278 [Thelohanellus kitauei]
MEEVEQEAENPELEEGENEEYENYDKMKNRFVTLCWNPEFEKERLSKVQKVIILESIEFADVKSKASPCGILIFFGLTKTGQRRKNETVQLHRPAISFIYHDPIENFIIFQIRGVQTLGRYPNILPSVLMSSLPTSINFIIFSTQQSNIKLMRTIKGMGKIYQVSTDRIGTLCPLPSKSAIIGFAAQMMTFCKALKRRANLYIPSFDAENTNAQNVEDILKLVEDPTLSNLALWLENSLNLDDKTLLYT